MIYFGEVRIYVGGRMELYASGETFVPVWIPGKAVVTKARYHNKGERQRIIRKAQEIFGEEIEVGIIPDIMMDEEDE